MILRSATKVVALLFAVTLLAGLLPAQLVLITGNSMEPTLHKGDVVLTHDTDSIDKGDVAVFYSPDRGQEVAHRVVETTEDGYITQGDNNPSTDQSDGLPPVQDSQIQGEVVQIGEQPATLPIGNVLSVFLNRPAAISPLLAIVFLTLLILRQDSTQRGRQNIEEVGDVIRPLLLIAFVASIAFMQLGAASTTVAVLFTEDGGSQPTVEEVGEEATIDATIESREPAFSHQIVSADGPVSAEEIRETEERGSSDIRINVETRATEGVQQGKIIVYNYPAVLPSGIIETLHRIHPLVAAATVSAVMFIPVWLIYLLVIDPKELFRENTPGKGRKRRRKL